MAKFSDGNSTWWDGFNAALDEIEARVEGLPHYDEVFVGTLRKWTKELRDGERNSENL